MLASVTETVFQPWAVIGDQGRVTKKFRPRLRQRHLTFVNPIQGMKEPIVYILNKKAY